MGDLVAVMRGGVLQQAANPQELYAHPTNLFVAGFIGSPAMNLVEATFRRSNGHYEVAFGGQALAVPGDAVERRPALGELRRPARDRRHPS